MTHIYSPTTFHIHSSHDTTNLPIEISCNSPIIYLSFFMRSQVPLCLGIISNLSKTCHSGTRGKTYLFDVPALLSGEGGL